jgi:hypothetical protein
VGKSRIGIVRLAFDARKQKGMKEEPENRFQTVIGHIVIESQNMVGDIDEYESMGFHVETVNSAKVS